MQKINCNDSSGVNSNVKLGTREHCCKHLGIVSTPQVNILDPLHCSGQLQPWYMQIPPRTSQTLVCANKTFDCLKFKSALKFNVT